MPEDVHPNRVESLIGARVLLLAGLISLLAGAVFFVKLSNDHQWIPPEVRIVCGIAAGLALLLGGAWRLRRERTLIAEGVTGLGASVLYLSLWGAFGPFHLIDYRVAFAAMAAVSGVLALIAWRRGSQNVALAGLVGGYLTPALLVAGPFDRIGLAVYLAILCGAMLVLAVRCRYRFVEAASFAAALLYAPVFAPSHAPGDPWSSTQSLLVASALFAEFALALFVAARREQTVGVRRIALLAAEVLAYVTVLELELSWNPHSLAIADTALAAVLLGAVATRVPASVRTAYAWLGIGVLTRAIEAWGGSHALTATVAVEGAGLIYVGLRSDRAWMRTAGLVMLGLASIGATLHLAFDAPLAAVLNTRTFTAGAVVLALLAAVRELTMWRPVLRPREGELAHVGLLIASALGVGAMTLDAVTATAISGVWTSTTQAAVSVIWSLAATVLVALGFRFRSPLARWLGIGLFGATIAKVFVADVAGLDVVQRVISALVLGAVLVVVAGIYQAIMLRERRAS
ncbi:MAG TPA: DUF2339 domain-containing protein [Candidatus Elarobacter sp.]|nr:DUF2339 domain-containing protein [Candidatus Elarobacter sp.]